MILTDGVNTYTNLDEAIRRDKPIQNSNVAITLGGFPKKQADSQRLQWESKIRVKQNDWPVLNSILTNFSAELTYTPIRKLAYKSSIAPLKVICQPEEPDQTVWDGEVVYYLVIRMEEAA